MCRGRRVNDEAEGRSRATDHPESYDNYTRAIVRLAEEKSVLASGTSSAAMRSRRRSRATDHPEKLRELIPGQLMDWRRKKSKSEIRFPGRKSRLLRNVVC
jgi:hypothetical protein